jgi:hypothetical protein
MFDKEELWEKLEEEECLVADGFDDAIIGISYGIEPKAVYSVTKCIEVLLKEGMTEEDALEHFDFNVAGGYVGPKTPLFVYDYVEEL